jgi:hypothetical protein
MNIIFFTMLLLSPFSYVSTIVGCAFDKQAIRQDDQEKIFLQESAKTYWDGIRWGIPSKSAVYYENPLVRARWENNPTLPYARVTEVNILHIEIQATKTTKQPSPTEIHKTATVYVFVQGIALNNTLQSKEIQQRWYRNGSGWFVSSDEK